MNTAVTVDKLRHRPRAVGMLTIAASLAAITANAVMVVGGSNTTTVSTPSNTVIMATSDTTFTVTMPGEIELLLVGGGGGAGGSTSASGYNGGDSRGGGGGGGGVIHKTNFRVEKGTYTVKVGAGGVVNRSHDTIALARGGDTTIARVGGGGTEAFELTAPGGGPGGCVDPTAWYDSTYLVGASGGGGSKHSNGKSYPGGTATVSSGVLGNNGANATDYKNGGGGGGAVGAGSGVRGGDGYLCNITGVDAYYGGGGGGGRRDSSATAAPGNGGGKACYGGGGTAQIGWGTPEAGGSGVVIVKFAHAKTTYDFSVRGYDAKVNLGDDYKYLVITNDTTLRVYGSATCEVLLVGGGGGAGANADSDKTSCGGGGGGGGGVIHMQYMQLEAGDYPITVGAGGAVNTGDAATTVRGGDTSAFGFTAIGGGPGAKGNGSGPSISGLGASGGGGATDGANATIVGGTPLAAANNLGNAGASATSYGSAYGQGAKDNSGGGGGAGGAANGVNGGDGYPCAITGALVYYAGGGAGGQRDNTSTATPVAVPGQGGGRASWGGGGSGGYRYTRSAEAGGHGIVIIRYRKTRLGTLLMVR